MIPNLFGDSVITLWILCQHSTDGCWNEVIKVGAELITREEKNIFLKWLCHTILSFNASVDVNSDGVTDVYHFEKYVLTTLVYVLWWPWNSF